MVDSLVSVLLPTRGRPELLRRSVYTLFDRTTFPERVQVCYGVDVDDVDTCALVQSTLIGPQDVTWVSPISHGYGGFHTYANELASRATGDWLMLWNDDALMCTDRWDEIIESYDPLQVLSPRCNHAEGIVAFPIVPRIFVEVLGHFSLNPHNDTWWQYVAGDLDLVTWVDIDILHDRFDLTGNNGDETYARTRQQSLEARTADRFWNDDMALMERDKVTLREWLERRGERDAGARNG